MNEYRRKAVSCGALVLWAGMLLLAEALPAQDERAAADRIFGARERETPPPVMPAMAAAEKRLSDLEKSVATVEARLGRPVQTATAAYNFERRMQDFERRLAEIERDIKRLDERLRRLERNK